MIFLHSCLSLALFVPLQDAAPEPAPEPAPADAWELGSLDYKGLDAFFVSEKDARLLAALRMVDDRLQELPGELGGMDAPSGLYPVLRRMVEGPMSLRVMAQDEPIAGMMAPVFGELRLTEASAGEAESLVRGAVEMLQMTGVPVEMPEAGALSVVQVPVPMWLGGTGRDMVLRFGKDVDAGAPSPARFLPEGVAPACTMRLDYSGVLDLVRRFASATGNEADLAEMDMMVEAFGLRDLAFEYSFGFDANRAYEVVATEGYAEVMRAMGMEPGGALSPDRVAWIPEDASWALAMRMNWVGYVEAMNDMMADAQGMGDMDLIQMVSDELGMDIRGELLDSLGEHFLMYGSDATGGGGLTSTVMVMELTSPEDFDQFASQALDMIGAMAAAETDGYVQMRRWNDGDQEFVSVQTPGFPMPLELTMGIVGNAAIFAVTPQGAVAAARQITSGTRSLLDQRSFIDQLPDDMSGTLSVMFLDTPRFLRDGYGVTSMLCSAIANGVRSRDGKREPGLILPAYQDLARDAKAIVAIGHMQGDVMVQEYRGDRSHLVNAAGLIGWFAEVPMSLVMGGAMIGGGVSGFLDSREIRIQEAAPEEYEIEELSAEEVAAWEGIAEIHEALEVFAASNGGRYPATLAELAKPDANGNQYLAEYPIDPWGLPYEYTAPEGDDDYPFVWSRGLDEEYETEDTFEDVVEEPVIKDAEVNPRRVDLIQVDIAAIEAALYEYAIRNGGSFPDSLTVLVTPDENGMTYLNTRSVPQDPWGNEYQYSKPQRGEDRPRVYSLGADGKPGGTELDADIDNH